MIQTRQVCICSRVAIVNQGLSQRCVGPCPFIGTRDLGIENKQVGGTKGLETSLPTLGPPLVTFELAPPRHKGSRGLPRNQEDASLGNLYRLPGLRLIDGDIVSGE